MSVRASHVHDCRRCRPRMNSLLDEIDRLRAAIAQRDALARAGAVRTQRLIEQIQNAYPEAGIASDLATAVRIICKRESPE